MARLLLFAAARDAAGCRSADFDASSVGEALTLGVERFGPAFERVLGHCTILIGDERVEAAAAFGVPANARTEIAVLPPVSGGAGMIDVGGKEETRREAVAACRLVASARVRDRLLRGEVPKGDAVGAARVAGMLAAKRVPELIPACHPVRMSFVEVVCEPDGDDAIEVRATVRGTDRTGFEMEALTAASVAALTLYDMGKGEDPAMRIEGLRLLSKSGGKTGEWRAP